MGYVLTVGDTNLHTTLKSMLGQKHTHTTLMTPSNLPQRKEISVKAPLPGYYDVIISDLCPFKNPSSDVNSRGTGIKQEQRPTLKKAERWIRVEEWTVVSTQTRSIRRCDVFCKMISLVFVMLTIFIAFVSFGFYNRGGKI